MTPRGFTQPLYILPFDHRGSFETKMFGWHEPLTEQQTAEIAAAKVGFELVAVGLAIDLRDARRAAGVDPVLGLAQDAGALFRRLYRGRRG